MSGNHCCRSCFSQNAAELSRPLVQNVNSGILLDLGQAIYGGNGPCIRYTGNKQLLLNPGLYSVSYSTSAVWTTTPYGTNEAILQVRLNGNPLPGSVVRGQIPPQTTNVGSVPYELNLAKTILVQVTDCSSPLTIANISSKVMGFSETTVTIVKIS